MGNWNRGTCQRPIGAPVSEINKAKNKQIPHLVPKLKQSIISIRGLCWTWPSRRQGTRCCCTYGREHRQSVGAKLNTNVVKRARRYPLSATETLFLSLCCKWPQHTNQTRQRQHYNFSGNIIRCFHSEMQNKMATCSLVSVAAVL